MNPFRFSRLLKPTRPSIRTFHSSRFQRKDERLGMVEETGATAKKLEDLFSKHRQSVIFGENEQPVISKESFVAPCALVSGNVELYPKSSIWFGCVVKADVNLIRIGGYTNIQDNTVIEEAFSPLHEDHDGSTIIGGYVTIGHSCVLRACTIEDWCLVGMGSVLEEGSYMERHSVLGAGSVLTEGTRVPSKQLWRGSPAVYVRDLTEDEIRSAANNARKYVPLVPLYQREFDLYDLPLRLEAEQLRLPLS